ncbi:hypothetical protein HX848_00035 [Marine Group I thaumarchaeote]|uniref:Uncharacterized protein n=1 Tax=Marine Group I thaumarchaeote TaxID=2511932 RepID=A0A7K4MGP9_9ARCH|nr:hypothetical protein [Marine Group I thaumarchaeote]
MILSLGFHVPSDAFATVDTWTDATTTNVGGTHMYGVSMSDASNGVAVGLSGQIVFTTNGGVDWTDATTTNVGSTYMLGVSMSDASNGVAVGDSGQIVFTVTVSSEDTTTKSNSTIMYPPHIHDEVTVSINSNEEFTLNLKDKEIAMITSRVGDTVDIAISVGDDKTSFISQIKLMTNFAKKPSGINSYFATNYNDYRQVGLSVYEWYQYKDDIKYDYGGTISWNEPSTMIRETLTNHGNVGRLLFNEEELIIVFSLNMNNVMDETQILTKIMDSTYMVKRSVLPFTLETLPKIIEKSEEIAENPIISENNESEFSIKSNKPMYENGNKVVITGNIPADSFDPKAGENIKFSITSPENEIILTGQFAPQLDGSFIFETFAMDSTWKTDGNYTFNLNFGLINSNLIISYDNSQFENVDLETRTDEKVVEPVVTPPVVTPPVVTPPVVEEPESTQLGIAPFVDQSKDSQHYTDRYFNEPKYKQWFDKNYPRYISIYEAVGLEEPVKENIPEIKIGG